MEIILFQAIGAAGFLAGTIFIGAQIRSNTTKEAAQKMSRISHVLFWAGLVLPEFAGIFYPGLTQFDALLGIPSLPFHGVLEVVGWLALAAGIYYLAASNFALKSLGAGFAAFKLTRHVVIKSVYEQVRNPMSLGTYLSYFGISLISGSTYLLLGTLFVIVPVHVFNLLYFEEGELRVRYGASYEKYKERVPFICPRRFLALSA